MLLIWGLSSISIQFNFAHVPFQDKGVHFVEYGTLAVLLRLSTRFAALGAIGDRCRRSRSRSC